MRFRLFLFSFLSLALLFTPSAQASIGVGVGTGRIQLEEELKPGILYQLPSISVINTGDEAGEYILDVSFRENQSEMRPNVDWFTYKPEKFSLEPGEGKIVEVTLTLPVKTVPGDYFAFLEARPIATSNNPSGASIGVAAASKLYFTIAPANTWEGFYYRALSLWNKYQPIPQIITGTFSFLIIIKIVRNFISLDISLKKRTKKNTFTTDKKNDEE
ncbi:MAG: hypothetical protein A2383_02260 [Candidatus Pacebacteria bacterium RIFOXYB1_FULL_39_46]|nr:MAG: hypothetical protein A2383_02260 [Candidatus Pacebacteria bacterium RIFOXYB1_FULL_39_46]OGJ39111.1 MAG: hypothetical protein A2182_02190 [Candidatus Pacebacteria bacterium RIFOXYA1_FULL_38_18]OGJ40189.1 MAG: hypothetical protein A2582_03815 [Candidatus Pacebacteria bacterium RIFOXYD1_FULL_39_27]OGJ41072.1 MAG: hypothetical protein A2411_01160 [Candidatus Pacebacteria bacterium RIFOXYC1_FULL_39_21]